MEIESAYIYKSMNDQKLRAEDMISLQKQEKLIHILSFSKIVRNDETLSPPLTKKVHVINSPLDMAYLSAKL